MADEPAGSGSDDGEPDGSEDGTDGSGDGTSAADAAEGEATDTREAIMLATYRVLREHGFDGLSISRIADEADLTKAALYHHFDGKHELMLAFLEYMLAHFEAEFRIDPEADPRAALDTYLDAAFEGAGEEFRGPRGDTIRGQGAYVEVRAQAVHDEAYRERFTQIDRAFADQLAAIVRTGVESGAFRSVDPDRAASVLLTLSLGAIFHRQTASGTATRDARAAVDEWVDAWLLPEDD